MMQVWNKIIALGVLLLSVVGPFASAQTLPTDDRTVIAYMPQQGGQILIPVWLNSTRRTNFVLDTGSSVSMITDTLAKSFGLPAKPAVGDNGRPILWENKQAQLVTLPLMRFGTITFQDNRLIILNEKELHNEDGNPVGIIGANVFAGFPVYFDFSQKQVTIFFHSPITPAELQSVDMQDAAAVTLTTEEGSYVYRVKALLSNAGQQFEEDLQVDTGGPDTIISQEAARKLGLHSLGAEGKYPSIFGEVSAGESSLSLLSLGSSSMGVSHPKVIFFTGKSPAGLPPHLGLDVLSHYRVLMDFGAKKMYLKPLSASAPAPIGPPPVKPVAVVPYFRSKSGRMLLHLQLAGLHDKIAIATFLVDTGTTSTMLTESMAKSLDLDVQPLLNPDKSAYILCGVPAGLASASQVTIGAWKLANPPYAVIPDKALTESVGESVDGVLGGNFFSVFPFLVDPQTQQLSFYEHGPVSPEVLKAAGMAEAQAVPLTETGERFLYALPVSLVNGSQNADTPLLCDTGATRTTLAAVTVKALGLKQTVDFQDIHLPNGKAVFSTALLPSLRLSSGQTFTGLTIDCLPEQPGSLLAKLGLDAISRDKFLFDAPGGTLYLQPLSGSVKR